MADSLEDVAEAEALFLDLDLDLEEEDAWNEVLASESLIPLLFQLNVRLIFDKRCLVSEKEDDLSIFGVAVMCD